MDLGCHFCRMVSVVRRISDERLSFWAPSKELAIYALEDLFLSYGISFASHFLRTVCISGSPRRHFGMGAHDGPGELCSKC